MCGAEHLKPDSGIRETSLQSRSPLSISNVPSATNCMGQPRDQDDSQKCCPGAGKKFFTRTSGTTVASH